MKTPLSGDIYRYKPTTDWCHHGLLIVNQNGSANDTYWGFGTHGRYAAAEIPALPQLTYIGNIADFRLSSKFEYEQYADADKLWIPMGGGSEQFYVRCAARPDVARQIRQQEEIIQQCRADIKGAINAIERAQDKIATLLAGRAEVSL